MSTDFELGAWLGRREAFSYCAARASAADIACLRRIRNQKLYKRETSTWAGFCSTYLGSSKTQIDLLIRYLDEFGPAYFLLNHLTRVTPEEYRAIAAYISDQGITVDGRLIPFDDDHTSEIVASVDALRRAIPGPKKKLPPDLLATLGAINTALNRLDRHRRPLTMAERQTIIEVLTRFVELVAEQGIHVTL